jgi:class III poly(R)-hydroxyalkanoic acid synthase PhaE subunit
MTKNGTDGGSSFDPQDAMASMMNAVSEAQQRWLRSAFDAQADADAMPPLFADAAQQWARSMQSATQAWTADVEPITARVLDRVQHGQDAMLRIYQLVLDAWQEAAQQAEDGEDVAAVMDDYVERVDEQARKAVNVWSEATQDQTTMWEDYLGVLQRAGLPHGLLLRMQRPDASRTSDTASDAFFEHLYKLFEFETLSERLLDAPALGLSREFTQEVAQGFKAFQEAQRAGVRYRSTLASIATDATQHFLRTLGTKIREGEAPETLQELSKLWTKEADRTFVRAFRTDDYIGAQNDYLEASLRLRKQQRTISEAFQRALDQPTRSELDEVYELLHRLRQENKELTRAVAALRDEREARTEVHEALREEMDRLRARVRHVEQDAAPDDLTAISGIGSARAETLRDAGITTYAQLATADAAMIRDAFGTSISDERVQAWQSAARDLAD